ncbi:MAG: hypothetical protein KDK39_01225 [Leptospiraceae bacterium]|nr:hypothetical protein [Leptospiraceae bacterium]
MQAKYKFLFAFSLAAVFAWQCSSADSQEPSDATTDGSVVSSREMEMPAPSKDECTSGDCETGSGLFRWTNGDIYKGGFKDGQRNGTGAYHWKSGASYVGEWQEGKRHGKGVYLYPNKDQYEGQFVNDQRNGKGRYTYADETVHPAQEWQDGQPLQPAE